MQENYKTNNFMKEIPYTPVLICNSLSLDRLDLQTLWYMENLCNDGTMTMPFQILNVFCDSETHVYKWEICPILCVIRYSEDKQTLRFNQSFIVKIVVQEMVS